MALPTLRSLAARRQAKKEESDGGVPSQADSEKSQRILSPPRSVDIRAATATRRNAIFIACAFFWVSVIFLILTIIGNINNDPVIRRTYFYKLDLTNIIPASAGDITLASSLARSLGLHDFYQVGLWNFCEGYNSEGITHCSTPRSLYWFNPVQVLLNELLSGATIALPAEITSILNLIRIASHVMFGFFLTGICMNFVSIFITPIVLYSRWWSLPIVIWTFIAALLTVAATIIATVMALIFKNVVTGQPGLNIGASVGTVMFAFMWLSASCTILGFAIHLCLSCCGASRRDVRTGRKKGNKAAYPHEVTEKKDHPIGKMFKIPKFGRRKNAAEAV